jgi:hypothetical protein
MEPFSIAATCIILGGTIGVLMVRKALTRPGKVTQLPDEERLLTSRSYISGRGTDSATSCIVQLGVEKAFSEKGSGGTGTTERNETKEFGNEDLRRILQDKKRELLKEISAVERSMADLPLANPRVHLPLADDTAEESDLDEISKQLFSRLRNWHGLVTSKFGKLIRYHRIEVSKNNKSWQELTCYLFEEMLICVKERGSEDVMPEKKVWVLKGSVLVRKHLQHLKTGKISLDL